MLGKMVESKFDCSLQLGEVEKTKLKIICLIFNFQIFKMKIGVVILKMYARNTF